MPRNAELISGQDVNTNVGIQSKMFLYVLGHKGIVNSNLKGKYLIFVLKNNKFRVLLTNFKHSSHNTWRYFNSNRSPHMLDKFTGSRILFRQVKYCRVVNIGMHSDQKVVQTTFNITAIKFKVTENIVKQI